MRPAKTTLILVLILFISACGLHLRRPQDFPNNLRQMTLSTNNVYQGITAELKRLLKASKVDFTSHAPIQLTLKNSHFSTDVPVVFSGAAARAYSYTLSVSVQLSSHEKIIFDKTLQTRKSVTYNVNQVGQPVVTPLMRERLTEDMVYRIYNLLSKANVAQ